VDVIVTTGTGAVIAAKQATASIPIVFTRETRSPPAWSQVWRNREATSPGCRISCPMLPASGSEFLREIVPNLRRLAILTNIATPIGAVETSQLQAAARPVGIEILALEIRLAEDISPGLEALKGRADALYVVSEPLMASSSHQYPGAERATADTSRPSRVLRSGGLMSYGPNILNQFRRTADIVDKILRGSKPAAIPVEQPTKFDLIINITTAKALGLEIPPTLLALADEVIQ